MATKIATPTTTTQRTHYGRPEARAVGHAPRYDAGVPLRPANRSRRNGRGAASGARLASPSQRVVWVFGAVALGSLAALVLSVYVRIPAVGPFPELYEPIWYADKYLAAAAAAVAGVVALVAALSLRRRPVRP